MTGSFSEQKTVQNPIIKYAQMIGWKYVPGKDALALRGSDEGLLFTEILSQQIKKLNPEFSNDIYVKEIISQIKNVQNNMEGNEQILFWLRGIKSIYHDEEKRSIDVDIIDYNYEDPFLNNTFQVTDEWKFTNGKYSNREDIVFLINGIPIIVVETKASQIMDGIEKGLEQIRRYHNETPEMMTHPQIYNVPNILDFYYSGTWSFNKKNLFNWKDEEKGNFENKVKKFFEISRILQVLHDYILFYRKDDEFQKIILRQHQTRAVEKILDRSIDSDKKRGLIWHSQGSGKTLTMIITAQQLLHRPEFEKPTVIMLVDRNELESQLFNNLESFGVKLHRGMEIAESKDDLKELILSDYRGLIVSMIHKFDKIPENLNKRSNIFVLVDEAHRTTTSDLGTYLLSCLPNATFFGFTGTPIDKIAYGKGTFKIFGKDDENGYLDKYSIAESIEDGTTVPLHYALAPNEIRVPKDILEQEFLSLKETEGINDIDELNKILDKAVKMKNFLKSDDRIDKVTSFVASHFKNNVEPLDYKAFLVGVDRTACALLKKSLDRFLPLEYSEVVYTPMHNDSELLKSFYLTEDKEKQIRKDFTNPKKLPKILIVTEKLLTGFDAPILYCMYLDKPMRDHTLLQAIARVNRPYEDKKGIKKPSGFVVDFIGIFDRLEKALSFDSEVVGSVITNIDILKTVFDVEMKKNAVKYLDLSENEIDDKTVEKIVTTFLDKKSREQFLQFFKQLQTLYEIISPDPFLRPFIDDYGKLSIIYKIVRNAYSSKVIISNDLMKKTEQLVRETVSVEGLESILPIYKIDENTLAAICNDKTNDESKVINLSRSLIPKISDNEDSEHYLIPIRERAQSIKERFDDRQVSTKQALDELSKILQEFLDAKKELKEKGFDVNTFSIYWILKQNGINDSEKIALDLKPVFDEYSNYKQNKNDFRLLKADLYQNLLSICDNDIEKTAMLIEKMLNTQTSLK